MAGRLSKIDIAEAERALAALGIGPDRMKDLLRQHMQHNEAIDAMEQVFKRKPDILSSGPSPTDTYESLGRTAKDLYTIHSAVLMHRTWYTCYLGIDKAMQPVFPEHEINYVEQLRLDVERALERYRTEPEIRAKELAEKNGCYLIIPATIQ